MEWLALLLLGFGTGVYGVLVGAGGGFIMGPVLLLFFDLEKETVAGTTLALVAINSISGGFAFRRLGLVDRRSGLLFAAAAIPGSVMAPFVIIAVAGGAFKVSFGVLLLSLAALIAFRPNVSDREPEPQKAQVAAGVMVRSREITSNSGRVYQYQFNEWLATLFNFFLGFLSSFFGTGGGFIRTPVLVYAFSFPIRVAVATSIFMMGFYTSAGAITHAALGHVEWFPTLVLGGIGLVLGGQVGARLTNRVRGPWILRLLLIVVLALGIQLIVDGIRG